MGQSVTAVGQTKRETKKELKKHAAAIHCSNTLSLLQRKITNALLYHAYNELMLKEEHEITVKQLCRLIGYHGHNHSAIKEALRGLISTVIEWNLIHDETGTENWTASSIIASVSLEGPLCYYAYSPRMKQLLHSPSMFGKIDLVIQSHFRSSYGLALYENCIRYRGLPYTKWFEMEMFKKLMGVPSGKYPIFRDFKRRVLDKAIDEVNTYSGLIITAEFVRERRRVLKLRFSLKERAKKVRLGRRVSSTQSMVHELREKLIHLFGLSEEQAEQLLTEYSNDFVAEKVAIIEASKPYQTGKVQNLPGYLFSAIKNDYRRSSMVQECAKTIQEEQEFTELKRHIEMIRCDYRAYREEMIHEAIQVLEEDKKAVFMAQFFDFATPVMNTILHLQGNKYSRDTVLESPQMRALLRQFALRELDTLVMISLEEFVAAQQEERRAAWQKLKSYDPDHDLLSWKHTPEEC